MKNLKKTMSIFLSFIMALSITGSSFVSFADTAEDTASCNSQSAVVPERETDIQTLDDEGLIAFAVYSEDDDSLTFYSDTEQPNKHDIYNGKTVDDLFTKFEDKIYTSGTDAQWSYINNKIKSVTFDESFAKIHPVSTSYWFYSFLNCTEINGLQYLNTSNETNMDDMFYNCHSLASLDLRNFDTSNVTSMENMFYNCYSLTELDFSSFNTSNVTSMSKMFSECSGITYLDLSSFDYTNVTSTSYMMNKMTSLESVIVGGTSQTSAITTTADMFYQCTNLKNIDFTGFNTENVTNMDAMFRDCTSLEEVYINTLDAHKLTSANRMFQDCTSLTTIYSNDDIFNTGNLTTKNSDSMFLRCTSLVGGNGTAYTSSTVNSKYAHIDLPGNKGYFTEYASSAFAVYSDNDNSLTFYSSSDMPNIGDRYNGKTATDIYTEFDEITYKDITEVPWYDIRESIESVATDESFKDIEITNMDYWFDGLRNCADFMLDNMDTSHLISMEYTFFGCEGISDVDMLFGIDISKVDDISRTFAGCSNIENINGLASLGSATDIRHIDYAFLGCSKLSDISGLTSWDISNVNNMTGLFYYCTSLSNVDVLSNWTTGSETKLDYMFAYCETLENINGLSGWDTAKVTSAKNMFYNCINLTDASALACWNTAKTTDVSQMFDGCTSLTTLDFTGWDTSKVTSYSNFAVNCKNLEKIIVDDNFDLFEKTETALVNNASTWYGTETCMPVSTDYMVGVSGADTYTTYIQNHTWNPNPEFIWSDDYSECKIDFTCTVCGETAEFCCDVSSTSTEATCTTDGETIYTAVCILEGETFENQKVIINQEALGHIIDVSFEWSSDAQSCEALISCERGDLSVTKECTVRLEETVEPSDTEDGFYRYIATVEYDGQTYTNEKEINIPASGHTWDLDNPVWNWLKDSDGTPVSASATFKCITCGETVTVTSANIETIDTKAPTCTKGGYNTYEASVIFEDNDFTDTYAQELSALGHNYVETSRIPATCTENGEIVYTCTRCDASYTEVIPATGHSWSETEYIVDENGNIEHVDVKFTCTYCGEVKEGVVTVETEDTGITAHAEFDWNDFIDADTIIEYFDEGKDLDFIVQVSDYNRDVPVSDKNIAEEAISELYENREYSVFYIDIDLIMNIYNEDGTLGGSIEFHESLNPIAITIAVPEELLGLGKSNENIEYRVIRIHDGEIEWLETVDNGDGTITFVSDLFSTYAVVAVEPESGEETPNDENSDDKGTGTESPISKEPDNENPDTTGSGDTDKSTSKETEPAKVAGNTDNGTNTNTETDNGGKENTTDNGGKSDGTIVTEGAKTSDSSMLIAAISAVVVLCAVLAIAIVNRKELFGSIDN